MSTFIFINPPPNLEFGIDFNQWTVGPNFKGLKLISPGLHFLHYHLLSSNQTGFISGFFHRFEEDQVIVWKWNASIEDWQPEEDVEQLKRVNDSVANQEMDRFLGYPPLNPTSKWHGLSHLISGRILDQIMPNTKSISAMTTSSLHSQLWSEARKADLDLLSAAPLLTDNLDGKKFVNFTPISLKLSFPPNSTPDEITKHSLDKSYLLDITIDQNYHSPLDLLGELQLSFIMFHLGQFYDGFEQWKVLVSLICNCKQAVPKYESLYVEFVGFLN
jgi:A1 cistron-splicing factor AAR2